MTFGTAQGRRIALSAGLALLALLNLLDIVGVLALDLEPGAVALTAALWVGTIYGWAGPDLEELKGHLKLIALALVPWLVLVAALGAAYPDAGDHYVIYATAPGQLAWAAAPVLEAALLVGLVGVGIAWVLEWRELRRTSPEERVLE